MNECLLSMRYSYGRSYLPYRLFKSQLEARQEFLSKVHKSENYVTLRECPYCAAKSFSRISEVDARGLPAEIVLCDACGGCFKSAILNREANMYHYKNISYKLRGKDLSEENIEKLFYKRLNKFAYERYYFMSFFLDLNKEDDLIVEYGCNDGANLFPWFKNGFNVLGIDMDTSIIGFGRKKGLNLVEGDLMNCGVLPKRPKLIILSHILEHVNDINAALNNLKGILDPDGYLFIESPGIRTHGLVEPLAYFDTEHNYNFDRAAMERVLARSCFKIIYCDEFIRFLCSPSLKEKSRNNREVISAEKMASRVLKFLIKMFKFNDMSLLDLLHRGARNDVCIRVFNKIFSLYFMNCYIAITKSAKRHGSY